MPPEKRQRRELERPSRGEAAAGLEPEGGLRRRYSYGATPYRYR